MTKSIYKIEKEDISEALQSWLLLKFPELENAGEVELRAVFNYRTHAFWYEVEI